jgi:hypothetical protein
MVHRRDTSLQSDYYDQIEAFLNRFSFYSYVDSFREYRLS